MTFAPQIGVALRSLVIAARRSGLPAAGLMLLGVAVAGVAIGQTITLLHAQLAFEAGTGEALQLAYSIGNADNLVRLAEIVADHGEPNQGQYEQAEHEQAEHAQAENALRRAVAANPRSARPWIALGLASERAGDLTRARDNLERAFQVDRQYSPAWALANFCFRRRDADCFWRASRRAAEVAPPQTTNGDSAPLLALANRMATGPAEALDRLGGSSRLERAYLDFLIGKKQWISAVEIARRLILRRSPSDTAQLDDFVNRLIDAGFSDSELVEPSVELWNATARVEALEPKRDFALTNFALTNGELRTAPLNTGFDWRLTSSVPVITHWKPGELELVLPEGGVTRAAGGANELLRQVLVLPKGRYCFRFEYSMQDSADLKGKRPELGWAIDRSESLPLAISTEWRESEWTFSVAQRGFHILQLMSRREPGLLSAGGSVRFRRLRLEVV